MRATGSVGRGVSMLCGLLAAGLAAGAARPATAETLETKGPGFVLHHSRAAGPDVPTYVDFLAAGVTTNEAFFHVRYPSPFAVYVEDDRPALDARLRTAFGDRSYASPCWLAAIGEAEGVYMLAPVRWAAETCEGRYTTYADKAKTKRLFAHELTHVLNGQILKAHGGRIDADDIAWFREGLAMLVAGQLGADERAEVQAALRAGRVPATLQGINDLSDVALRYNLMGSLAAYIDHAYGRETPTALMALDNQAAILSRLGVSEAALLDGWRRFAG